MPEKIAVVAGHICLDIIPTLISAGGGGLPAPGRLVECGPAVAATGGAVSNTGLALARLGVPVRLAAKVGDDLVGRGILAVLGGHGGGLAESMTVAPGAASSYTVVIDPPGLDRSFLHCPGANDTFSAADLREGTLEGAALLHFGYPPIMRRMYEDGGAECAKMLKRAREKGLTVSLDMARPDPDSPAGRLDWKAWLARVLPLVDVFGPSVEEILYMLDRGRFEELEGEAGGVAAAADGGLLASISERLLGMGAAVVTIKLGERGLYLRTTGEAARMKAAGACAPAGGEWLARELYAPGFEVKVAGATGAGDCAIAGFLAALMRGLGPGEALLTAAAVGACNVEAPDAASGVRPWEEVRARIESGWRQSGLAPELPGWRRDGRVWSGPDDGRAK